MLLPVRNEANMLRHLVARVDRLMYPRRQLRILLLIEHDDLETLAAARELGIPFLLTIGANRRRIPAGRGGPARRPEDQAERPERGHGHRGQGGLRVRHHL